MKRKLFALRNKKSEETGKNIGDEWVSLDLSYEDIYLQSGKLIFRKSVYLSCKNYQILSNIISRLAIQDLTVGMYIGNILKQHFTKYKDDIINLLEQYGKNADPFAISETVAHEYSIQYGDFSIKTKESHHERKAVYIDADAHYNLTLVIDTVSNKNFSAGSYLENVLEQHFAEYKEDIRRLCNQGNIRKVLLFD